MRASSQYIKLLDCFKKLKLQGCRLLSYQAKRSGIQSTDVTHTHGGAANALITPRAAERP